MPASMPHVQAHTSVHGATLSRGGMLLPLLRSGRSSSSSSSSSSHACEDIWPQTVHHRQLRSQPHASCDTILKNATSNNRAGWTLVLGRKVRTRSIHLSACSRQLAAEARSVPPGATQS
eukprot:scaffold95563_cov55-Phaeocystis_antarctica.AAC.3